MLLKICKIAKSESDTSLASEDIAPQSCDNLQTSVKFRDFEELYPH